MAQNMHESLVVISIPGLMLQDLSAYTSLSRLVNMGASGLINTNSAAKKSLAASYLTISAGSKAVWPNQKNLSGYQSDELLYEITSSEVYRRNTGNETINAAIVVPNIQAIIAANGNQLKPGLLGETLAVKEVPVLFIGNQDTSLEISRPGVYLAMNEKGVIANGFIDRRTYTVSPFLPTIYMTNHEFFYEKTLDFLKKQSGLVFLDLGDLARLDNLAENLSPAAYENARKIILSATDDFIGRLLEHRQRHSFNLFFITPYPDRYRQLSDARNSSVLRPLARSPLVGKHKKTGINHKP